MVITQFDFKITRGLFVCLDSRIHYGPERANKTFRQSLQFVNLLCLYSNWRFGEVSSRQMSYWEKNGIRSLECSLQFDNNWLGVPVKREKILLSFESSAHYGEEYASTRQTKSINTTTKRMAKIIECLLYLKEFYWKDSNAPHCVTVWTE